MGKKVYEEGLYDKHATKRARTLADQLGVSDEELRKTQAALLNGEILESSEELFEDDLSGISEASYSHQDVKDLAKANLNFLAPLCMPTVFEHDFPPVMLTIWQLLIQMIEMGNGQFPQLALGIPRGHAKTTLIKLFCVYVILFTKKKFILICASTIDRAENIVGDVVTMLSEQNVKSTFGDWKAGAEVDTKQLKIFGFRGRNIIIAAMGAEGSLRGMNVKNARPDVMIFEDVQTKENSESITASQTLERWMVGTAMKAKSPAGCAFVFVGNMYPGPNSILKKLKSNPTWIKFISGAILADGSALWEELRSKKSLVEELDNDIALGHPEIFFSEVLNDTEAGQNTTVDFSKFRDWQWPQEDQPQGRFIIIDPSQGKGLDSDGIGYFEVYDEVIGIRELISEKYSPGNLIRRALVLALKTNTRLVAIEAMAYQSTLLYWFEEVCKSIGITGIICVPIYANNHSKNSRIATGLKALQAGEMILHPSIRSKVQKQIADWQPLKRDNIDDMLDVIAYAPKVLADNVYDIASPFGVEVIESSGAQVIENNHLF